MKKLKISKKYLEKFEKWNDLGYGLGKIGYYETDLEIDLISLKLCNTSCFRKILHTIIDIDDNFKNKQQIHTEISNKDFTSLILIGVLEVIEE